ncbi:CDP-paratose 2-epimerase [Rugosimonospora africana]|uniref:CDP-paratose 2-epimerase n=1 Tax=Rugosimonospora africana TaxID=556532 RepID=A0A8J3QWR1_9ACTN|nr:CDP-paratose 2-epimerase [Rugosimonospora africana]
MITGGMGFIGISTARELARTDEVVLGYNRTLRSPGELRALIGAKVATVQLDVVNPYSIPRALAEYRPASIVHLAVPALGAMPPAEESLANVQGLMNVLESAHNAGIERVSVASSLAVYAGLDGGPFAEDRALPVESSSATSAMKKAEEILALHYADRTGMDLRLLRIGLTYGPLYHSLANAVGRLTHLAVRGALPDGKSVTWTPQQLLGGMDLCHVDDCARAVATIHRAEHTAHRIYNVSGGTSVSADTLFSAVAAAVPGAVLPDELRHTGTRENADGYLDISRARDEFGIVPRYDIEAGIRQYAGWLRDHDL